MIAPSPPAISVNPFLLWLISTLQECIWSGQIPLHGNKKVDRNVFALPLLINLGIKFKAGLIESISSHKLVLTLDTNYNIYKPRREKVSAEKAVCESFLRIRSGGKQLC